MDTDEYTPLAYPDSQKRSKQCALSVVYPNISRIGYLRHGQQVGAPCWSAKVTECITSTKLGLLTAAGELALAEAIARWALAGVHGQQRRFFSSSAMSHLGFSHWSSHLGRGQVVGFAHDQLHCVSSHKGAQLA